MGLLSRLLGNASEADVSGAAAPIQKTFRRGSAIFDVQQSLATYCK